MAKSLGVSNLPFRPGGDISLIIHGVKPKRKEALSQWVDSF
jgi:hypothetical protein